MASNSEYEQQLFWPDQNIKRLCFMPGDGSQMDINWQIYVAEREKKYWFKDVTGISGENVSLFQDNQLKK